MPVLLVVGLYDFNNPNEADDTAYLGCYVLGSCTALTLERRSFSADQGTFEITTVLAGGF